MNREIEYSKHIDKEHRKLLGQFFTHKDVVEFMCKWACDGAQKVLDPAVGNSAFLCAARKYNKECSLTGYEIDSAILNFFGNPSEAKIINEDYLLSDWNEKYDSIVCNPPYNRFQAIKNRKEIISIIYENTGIRITSYTNLYVLFLIKSIYQMADKGKLAYIIPSEFLNSKYGIQMKQLLLEKRLLKAIINFQNNDDLFSDATTTCCILLIDNSIKDSIMFYNLKTLYELESLDIGNEEQAHIVPYESISADKKWRGYLYQEEIYNYSNLVDIAEYCSITRGIATGDNSFFSMSKSKVEEYKIPDEVLAECICRSRDVNDYIFDREDYRKLVNDEKPAYILDIKDDIDNEVANYIAIGEENGINTKYILSKRNPWYSMEQKSPAPILVCSANRNGIKFVRNIADVRNLTAFHSVYVREKYKDLTDIIFCYFLTPTAQKIIRTNRKEMGNGLEKFQPGDLLNAKMLNVSIISKQDRDMVLVIYEQLKNKSDRNIVEKLDDIFKKYMSPEL